MNYKSWLSAGLLSAAVSVAATAHAEITWNEKHYNPAPLTDDVTLPMPCGGAMVFRKVFIPSNNPMDDYAVDLGQDDQEWGYVEHTRPTFVAGSFTEKNTASRYYLMAKYEMTDLQYKALVDEECVKSSNKLRLPAVSHSWINAMQAADRYNLWLREHAANTLPKEDGVSGFVRLPTEVEWEFAARGGLEVASSEFRGNRYPMSEGLNNYEWFAGAQSANGSLQLSGLLKPNPLGLHDMLGNASEMLFESFRLNKLDRDHGQAGGYIVRGGNYLTPQADIRNALRREESYYSETGEQTNKSTGFRLVLTSSILTSRERVASIGDNWKKLGSGNDLDGSEKTTADLAKLTAEIEDQKLKEQLQSIENQLRASNQKQEEARDETIRASLELGAFLCTKMQDDGRFVDFTQHNFSAMCDNEELRDELCPQRQQKLDSQREQLDVLTTYYADGIVQAAKLYSQADMAKQVPILNERISRNPYLSRLKPYLAMHWQHQQLFLNNKKNMSEAWLNNCKKLPKETSQGTIQ